MKVLIACEESQVVCKAFREKGHEAYSCDLQECSGGHPEWHYQMDVFDCIEKHGPWEMMIAHPDCTYLTVTANKWLKDQLARKSGALVGLARRKAKAMAIDFFMRLVETGIPKICIENPIGCMSTVYRKPDQIIQPFQFGHPEPKKTCLWLNNLPKLIGTSIVEPAYTLSKSGNKMATWYFWADKSKGQKERAKIRSRTFQGIANAMANQWG